ncbi:MAG: NAD(P)H-dependent oxidoreductase subunit E [Desulfosalsimonas sp.]
MEVGETTDDRRFSLEGVRCLGACGLAPVMVVNQDTYGGVKPDKVSEILEKYE